MSSIFRKAMGLFIVLEDEKPDVEQQSTVAETPQSQPNQQNIPQPTVTVSHQEVAKFEQHFAKLFDQANLPGPDYYEFWKMMDALESHILDPAARVVAVFESLKIQGLTKEQLFSSAAKYIEIVKQDKENFETAARNKADAEITARQNQIKQLLAIKQQKTEQLAQLQKDIATADTQATQFQAEIDAEQSKIASAQAGYLAACQAMLSKIEQDIALFKQKLG